MEVSYPLVSLFLKHHEAYLAMSEKFKELESVPESEQTVEFTRKAMAVSQARFETGIVVLISAVTILERQIYEVACRYIHFKSVEENLDRLKLESKWMLVGKMCLGIHIDEDSPEINELRQLVKARNAVAHPKPKFITATASSYPDVSSEISRFHHACRDARRTIERLEALVRPKAVVPDDPACWI